MKARICPRPRKTSDGPPPWPFRNAPGGSPHKGNLTYQAVLELAGPLQDHDPAGYWHQFMELVKRARDLSKS